MADLGRWVVHDPLSETTLQPYSYADNNPIFYNDPTGMIAQQPETIATIYKHKRTGEEVNVNDGANETVLVNGHDFAKAKTYARYYDSNRASLDGNSNYEVNQGYIDFYYNTRYGSGFSFASLFDSGPDKRKMPTSDEDTMILLEMPDIGRKGAAKGLLRTLKTTKSVNLPAWKTILIDIEHIASGHMKGGSRISSLKTLFPDHLSEKQVENLVRDAYRNSKKVKTQGERVLLRGNNIEMWVNTNTKTIETAYPIK